MTGTSLDATRAGADRVDLVTTLSIDLREAPALDKMRPPSAALKNAL